MYAGATEGDTEYAGAGGHDPATEPGANAYIKFDNGVGGFYVVVSKTTPGPKFSVEVAEVIPRPNGLSSGIEAGTQDLLQVLEQGGLLTISTGREGQAVVEIIAAILASRQADHAPIQIPPAR